MAAALDGIRVLDLSRVMSGPFASVMLSDLGADVVKVEVKGIGDVMRHMGGHHRADINAIFLGLNRGKRSISVDLRHPDGIAVVRDLAARSDVLLENFRPGVCASMGLGPDELITANPELVYVSISGYGTDSPASADPAYDTMIQGRSGMVDRQRRGRDGTPDLVRSFPVDKIAGFFAVQAVLAALYQRAGGGGGQHVSVPMFDASLYYLWPDGLTDLALAGDGVEAGTIFPLSQSLTMTADGHLTHMALSDKERAGVARAVGRPDLNGDPRFATTASWSRPENLAVYNRAVNDGFATLTTAEAMARLRAEGVPCAAVAGTDEILTDGHVVATGVIDEWDHPRVGRVRQPRFPVRFGNRPGSTGHTAPALGEHTVEVLSDWGIDDERSRELIESGAVQVARTPRHQEA
jgi:crotonobetainyl-CoA:carnitine CoA-transferase CaiB-like acyl-CoA transferase